MIITLDRLVAWVLALLVAGSCAAFFLYLSPVVILCAVVLVMFALAGLLLGVLLSSTKRSSSEIGARNNAARSRL